jgi:hypothetical protein
MNILLCLSEVLALCLRELGSLGLAERLAYRPPQLSVEAYVRSAREESRTQVWRPYRPSMLTATEGLHSLGTMSSGRTTLRLPLSQAREHIEGEE